MPYQPYSQFQYPQYQAYQPAQFQQIQQPNIQTGISGRFVASPDDITPQEVSMGSTPSLFPLADGSAVIAKQWANDGTIRTVTYSANETVDVHGPTLADVIERLNDMQTAMDAMSGAIADLKPKRTRRAADAED